MADATMDGPVTIKQLARMLGMAHSTVSRALNGHPAISEETRRRIQDLAQREGYVPNSAARSLKTAKSRIIGLVVPDIENRYYTTIAKTIADAAALQSRQMMLSTTDDRPDREQSAILNLLEAQAEGVVLAPTADPTPETLAMLKRLDVVQLLRRHPGIEAPFVSVDDVDGLTQATRHLADLGHRRIGYIGNHTRISTGASRLGGYLAVVGHDPEMLRLTRHCTPRFDFAEAAFLDLMSGAEPPTGLVLGGARYTTGVLSGAARLGLRIPEDLSLVGYGDGEFGPFLANGLTTLVLPEQEMADACAELLGLTPGGERETSPSRVVVHRPHLVVRHSTRRV
jgi:LacI family transcriptional regulator